MATPGSDFVLESGTGSPLGNSVVTPAGSISVTIRVKPVDDTQIEPDEVVTIELVQEPTSLYSIAAGANIAKCVIKDDDTNVVSVAAADANADEIAPDPGRFRISRTGSTAKALVVFYVMGGDGVNGAQGVDPALAIIRFVFDRPMRIRCHHLQRR